jgi:predicted hotdog family 3-hydroxylacyl-ACP dehydratase
MDPIPLDRAWILAHIPHQGRMCLLDAVTHWDAEQIRCRSSNHLDPDHPLRAHDRLGILCGVEYAAQAMAVHGALAAGALAARALAAGALAARDVPPPAAGFLAALRGVTLHALRLDDEPGDLIVTATRVAGDRSSALYEFEVRSAVRCLLGGRATVVLDANGRFE